MLAENKYRGQKMTKVWKTKEGRGLALYLDIWLAGVYGRELSLTILNNTLGRRELHSEIQIQPVLRAGRARGLFFLLTSFLPGRSPAPEHQEWGRGRVVSWSDNRTV